MPFLQLFNKPPTIDLMNRVIKCFGLEDINDTNYFTMTAMKYKGTCEKMKLLKEELLSYYLPCKKVYLDNIETEFGCLLILKQLLNYFNLKLTADKIIINKGDTYYQYSIIPKTDPFKDYKKNIIRYHIEKKKVLLEFE